MRNRSSILVVALFLVGSVATRADFTLSVPPAAQRQVRASSPDPTSDLGTS